MPIYEYVCLSCGRRIDVMHGINGTGPEACATCGGGMKKALTAPAIHFKGSGWAKKDAKASTAPATSTAKKDDAPAAEPSAPAAPAASTESAGTATPAPAAPAATPAPATGGSGS